MVNPYIRPDLMFNVPIDGGELHISPAYDVLHSFPPLKAYILKYWNEATGKMMDLHLHDHSAEWLVDKCGLLVLDRPFITAYEHDKLIGWKADQLKDGDLDGTT